MYKNIFFKFNWLECIISNFYCNSYLNKTAVNFQNPKTGVMLGIMELYDYIMFFLILILLVVTIFLVIAIRDSQKFLDHDWEERIPILIHFFNTSDYNFKKAHAFEFYWTIVPGLLLLIMAFPSFILLYAIDELVEPIYTITAVGNQWYWTYEYNDFNLYILFEHVIKHSVTDPYIFLKKVQILKYLPRHFVEHFNMQQFIIIDSVILPDENLPKGYPRLLATDQVLVLPVSVPLRMLVTSNDVIHSWAIPSFGVKMDAVPGRINQVSLTVPFYGTTWGQCSELCGVNHGFMPIEIRAIAKSEFLEFINLNVKTIITPYLYRYDKIFNSPKLNSLVEK